MRHLVILCGAVLLAACGGGSEPDDSDSAAESDARRLCLNSDCGASRQLVDLPDLENLLVTDDGRLLVTGQQNFYEVTGNANDGFSAAAFFPGTRGCSGLTQRGHLVYALCQGDAGGPTDFGGLMVLDLSIADASPEQIFSITGMTLPNGLVTGPDDTLYVTDGPIALEPKIVRLTLDPADPRKVLGQETWLLTFPEYPNGLAIDGNRLYTTLYNPTAASGTVARIDIQADGAAGPVTPLFTRGIMDDLNIYGDTLLVTDWQNNRLFQMSLDGELLQETAPQSFRQPSSVDVGRPPLIPAPAALITERYTGRGLWILEPR